MSGMSEITVRDVPDADRFEAVRDGRVLGHIAYRRTARGYAFLHTEVEPEAEGGGVGSALARGALDAVRLTGSEVLPYCPFVRGWIERHEEYVALVPQDQRAKFDLV
jgi:hypothetical protein